MLIKLSNEIYVSPDKITHMGRNWDYETSGLWRVTFESEENVLILSQAHFDELMACLPSPVEASKEEETQPVWPKADPELLQALRKAGDEWRATHAKS